MLHNANQGIHNEIQTNEIQTNDQKHTSKTEPEVTGWTEINLTKDDYYPETTINTTCYYPLSQFPTTEEYLDENYWIIMLTGDSYPFLLLNTLRLEASFIDQRKTIESKLIDDHISYKITCGGMSIAQGKLADGTNLYPNETPIPFKCLKCHDIVLYFKLPREVYTNREHILLRFHHVNVSIKNIYQNGDQRMICIPWGNKREMRFAAGMGGLDKELYLSNDQIERMFVNTYQKYYDIPYISITEVSKHYWDRWLTESSKTCELVKKLSYSPTDFIDTITGGVSINGGVGGVNSVSKVQKYRSNDFNSIKCVHSTTLSKNGRVSLDINFDLFTGIEIACSDG